MNRSLLVDILKDLQVLKNRTSEPENNSARTIFTKYGINFPINTMEDLDKLEENLKEEVDFISAVSNTCIPNQIFKK